MKVGGRYSFNGGEEAMMRRYPDELEQVLQVIRSVDASVLKTKISHEKTMPGRPLFHPKSLNLAYREVFDQ